MDAGLENVVAAQTVLSKVDGQNGRLIIRGHRVEDLARTYSFEQVVGLLWAGFFDGFGDASDIRQRLAKARQEAFDKLTPYFPAIAERPNMEGLRLALATCPDGNDLDTAFAVLAALTVGTAGAARLRQNLPLISPDGGSSHTDDFIYMLTGKAPNAALSHGMAAYFITVSEHGLNASTFAARVVASTQAGLTSAAMGGLCALKGPLHGGAPGPVLDMLDAIGQPEKTGAWVRGALVKKERLMGFGHRVYKVRDPRADALKHAVAQLPKSSGRLALAQDIETGILDTLAAEKPHLSLETNVEYYTAILLEALGISRDDFTCVFACARAAGWLAHAQEQVATKRIMRPKSVYVGPDTNMAPVTTAA